MYSEKLGEDAAFLFTEIGSGILFCCLTWWALPITVAVIGTEVASGMYNPDAFYLGKLANLKGKTDHGNIGTLFYTWYLGGLSGRE